MRNTIFLMSTVMLACVLFCAPAMGKPRVVKVKVRADSETASFEAFRAMDGDPRSMWHTRWGSGETKHPHEIVVDLGASYKITGFIYLPRTDETQNGTINHYEAYLSEDGKDFGKPIAKGQFAKRWAENVVQFPAGAKGRYLRLRALSNVNGNSIWTSVAELRIISKGVRFIAEQARVSDQPSHLTAELRMQFATLRHDMRHRGRYANQTKRPEAVILKSDRDPADIVLRRTAALLNHLKQMPGTPDLAAMEQELKKLQAAGSEMSDAGARRELFQTVCKLRRKIAFANPLLSFDKLLFMKKHRSIYSHMCDQYYGITARPGGGLYILHDPFGPKPRVEDILANSIVERGRLKGKKLDGGPSRSGAASYNGGGGRRGAKPEGGSFLSPDLSFDGKSILFAYVECDGDPNHRWHVDPAKGHWHEGWAYHVFKVNVDGTGLEQLTDGTWNDFDPCWLPNGRIAFITERRGGYLRCGRVCPTYTLYDMNAIEAPPSLQADSEHISAHFEGAWSLDWARHKDGSWYAIDMAPMQVSYHWPDCPNA